MKSVAFLAVLLGGLFAPQVASAFQQVACPIVIGELNRVRRGEDTVIHAMEKVAKRLGTSAIWVENCMRVYGRPIPRSVSIDLDLREEVLERMEEVDLAPEDAAPEDLAEPDIVIPELESGKVTKRKPNEHNVRRLPPK